MTRDLRKVKHNHYPESDMAVNPSQSFNFKSFANFQSESSHIDTKALLRQGHMDVGGNRYRVSLSLDSNQIEVSREQTQPPTKAGRFLMACLTYLSIGLRMRQRLPEVTASGKH
ncbi:hypothetical protein P4S72_29990 [Vibrio sp. PP-XX7]